MDAVELLELVQNERKGRFAGRAEDFLEEFAEPRGMSENGAREGGIREAGSCVSGFRRFSGFSLCGRSPVDHHGEERDVGGIDAGNARGLAEVGGADALELLA